MYSIRLQCCQELGKDKIKQLLIPHPSPTSTSPSSSPPPSMQWKGAVYQREVPIRLPEHTVASESFADCQNRRRPQLFLLCQGSIIMRGRIYIGMMRLRDISWEPAFSKSWHCQNWPDPVQIPGTSYGGAQLYLELRRTVRRHSRSLCRDLRSLKIFEIGQNIEH